jgi:hypothetical protein
MTYNITNYTYKQANLLGVKVFPSENKRYKLDVYDLNGNYITSVGALGYKDYPTYINEKGIEYAEKRRRLYKIRHNKDRHVKYSKGWLADKLLW